MESLLETTQKTLDMLAGLQLPNGEVAQKAYTTGLGYVWYDLQRVVNSLFPVVTPLRNETPRVAGDGDTATRWKAITAINTGNMELGVSEGHRGGVTTTALGSFLAIYKGLGLEDSVSFETEYAAKNLTPEVKANAVQNLLFAVMIGEEKILLDGNGGGGGGGGTNIPGLPLGVAPNPTVHAVAGGALTAQNTDVYVVALTGAGMRAASMAKGIPVQISRASAGPYSNTDTYGGGSSQVCATPGNDTTTGGNLALAVSCTPVKGAHGYAWFTCLHGAGAASAWLNAITATSYAVLTTNAPTGGTPPAGYTLTASGASADNSVNALVFDGIETLALESTGYYVSQPFSSATGLGTGLTPDGAGGIVEVDADLAFFYNNYLMMPQEILMNIQEVKNLTNKVIAGGSAPAYRWLMGNSTAEHGNVTAGALVRTYMGKYGVDGAEPINIRIHPYMTPGRLMYRTKRLPYNVPNLPPELVRIKTRQEYRQIDWPLIQRQWEYGVYVDELCQMYAPFAFGVRDNIANA